MKANTLYYFFSTIAQVFAAISALLAVFTHFKINEIKDFLVGDGTATFERMKINEEGYVLPKETEHKLYLGRLRDAVARKSILGILDVIKILAQNERKQGKDLNSNPRGLQYLEKRFEERRSQFEKIKSWTKKSIILAFIVISISLISLVIVEYLVNCFLLVIIIIITTIIVAIFSIYYTVKGIFYGLSDLGDV